MIALPTNESSVPPARSRGPAAGASGTQRDSWARMASAATICCRFEVSKITPRSPEMAICLFLRETVWSIHY